MLLPEKSFDTGELVLNYVESLASNPPLLMLHGLTGWWQLWEPQMPYLTSAWHVVRCDFRGHGKSGRVPGQYHIVDYAKDTISFLRAQFTEPVVLVGHSLGAMTALAVASQAPELVRAVILLDPPLFLRNSPLAAMVSAQNWFGFVYETLTQSSSYEQVLTRCQAASPDADQTAIKDQADNISCLDSDTVGVTLRDQLLAGWDLEKALQKITCPVLLMRGDWNHDAAVRDEDAEFVKATLPQLVDIKMLNGTHMFAWEQTNTTMTHVQTFLQSI